MSYEPNGQNYTQRYRARLLFYLNVNVKKESVFNLVYGVFNLVYDINLYTSVVLFKLGFKGLIAAALENTGFKT